MGRVLSAKVLAVVGVLVLIAAGITAYVIHAPPSQMHTGPASVQLVIPPATAPTHTAGWYVAHPKALKQDQKRCAGNAGLMSAVACQNVASADARLSVIEMQKAAVANSHAATPPGSEHRSP